MLLIAVGSLLITICYVLLIPNTLRDSIDEECVKRYGDEELLDETDEEIILEWMRKHIDCTGPPARAD